MNTLTFALTAPIFAVLTAAAIVAFFIVAHRRRLFSRAGTAPNNFPPDAVLDIGAILTGNKLGLTASLPITTFFTAPNAGLYMVAMAIQVTATDGTGTLTATMTTPNAGTVQENTPDGTDPAVAIASDAVLSATPADVFDGYSAAIPVWMAQGQTIRAAVVAAGLVATSYNVFVTAQRVF